MIDQNESQAWLIHQYPIRDHLHLVYLLTPDRLLKGFYRVPKKPYVLKPQPFQSYWISWRENKNAINISKMEANQSGLNLSGLQLFIGLYLNELIYNLCRDEQLIPSFYPLYQQLLSNDSSFDESLLRQFEWQILADCGYAIDFSMTCQQQAIVEDLFYHFDPSMGFKEGAQGFSGAQLLAIQNGQITYPETLKILKQILRMTIDHVLDGKVLHSRGLLREWLKIKA